MNDDIGKVQPFDSFSAVYKILGWAGYYRLLNNPTSRFQRILHQIYRPLAILIVVIYNLQHLIFTAHNLDDADKLMDSLMIEIPQMNCFAKVVTMFFRESRLERLNGFLKDDTTFRATNPDDLSILVKNKNEMHHHSRLINISVVVTSTCWASSYIVRRYNNPKETVPIYVPFATDTWPKFLLSVCLECGPVLWVGFGHISLDVLISTYYAHAQTQVKIIKQQLEHLQVESDDGHYLKSCFRYRDLTDKNVHKRFSQIVKRYEKLTWYTNEVDAIFNYCLTFQFFSSTTTVCFVIYSMSTVSITSFQFIFLVFLFCILLTQLLLYCYYGNLLEFESRSVNNSLYHCDWLTLSPLFRRQMLIAMIRWSQSIQPRVCYVIPLSLRTFITIVKSSYTLYTVLITAKPNI